MERYNMTQMAKNLATERVQWYQMMDTYGQIEVDEILRQDVLGYDLYQFTENNTHLYFGFIKRE